jgi:lipid-binding SYLF domain-containing protein
MQHIKIIGLISFLVIFLGACTTTSTKPAVDKRQDVLAMKNDTLSELYKLKPQTKSMIANAPGYAVFSNANVNIIFASFGGGYGVVRNNATGKYTYMKMGEVGVGLGLGVKDFRAIFIFHDKVTLNNFIESGWQFGGHADAAAVADDKGVGAVGGEAVIDNITIYQLTKTGLALQATVKGTKYWKDGELN